MTICLSDRPLPPGAPDPDNYQTVAFIECDTHAGNPAPIFGDPLDLGMGVRRIGIRLKHNLERAWRTVTGHEPGAGGDGKVRFELVTTRTYRNDVAKMLEAYGRGDVWRFRIARQQWNDEEETWGTVEDEIDSEGGFYGGNGHPIECGMIHVLEGLVSVDVVHNLDTDETWAIEDLYARLPS